MRTADDIVSDNYKELDMPSDGWQTTYTFEDVIKLINIARKEAIEECAKRAMICEEIEIERDFFNRGDENEEDDEVKYEKSIYSGGYIRDEHWVEVDKESILSLIKEIK